jgi:hypothetical protein
VGAAFTVPELFASVGVPEPDWDASEFSTSVVGRARVAASVDDAIALGRDERFIFVGAVPGVGFGCVATD